MNIELLVTTVAGIVTILAFVIYKLYVGRKPWTQKNYKELVKNWKPVAKVAQLRIFPIKSCKGIDVKEGYAHPMGLTNGDLQDR